MPDLNSRRSPAKIVAALLSALLALSIAPLVRSSATAADPTGEEVLEKYIQATGGRAAYDKIKSRVVTGKMSIPAQNLSGDITIYQKAPNKSYLVLVLGPVGQIERGSDGEVAWERNPMTGTRILEGDEKVQAERESNIKGDLDWKQFYTKVENKGVEQIGGKPAYKVVMTTKNGNEETRYYDVASGLLAQTEMTAKSGQGEFEIVATPSDWKEADGIKMPFKSTQEIKPMGIAQIIEMTKIESNTDIPDSKFELPDDVKALLNKKGPSTQPTTK